MKNNYVQIDVLESYKDFYSHQDGQRYPCSNQIVYCGIITADRDKAVGFMHRKNGVVIRERTNEIEWMVGAERWVWRNWNIDHRGYRFYKVAVDKVIDPELFQLFLLPKLGIYCCSFEII